MNSTHGKQGPLLYRSAAPRCKDNPVIVVGPQVPRHFQKLLPQLQLSGQFQGSFLHNFFFFISAVRRHNLCYFSLSARPSCKHSPVDVQASPHADTPTAEMIIWKQLWQDKENVFSTLFSVKKHFLKSAFFSL